jgi:hypothetical protein
MITTFMTIFFHTLNNYIRDKGIQWDKCVGFCSDGARTLTGRHSGVVSKVKDVAPDMNLVHCLIQWEALASNGMS